MEHAVKNLVKKRIFAEMAGVSGPAISKAVKSDLLKDAVEGTRINLNHPQAQAYLAKKGNRPEQEYGRGQKRPTISSSENITVPVKPEKKKTGSKMNERKKAVEPSNYNNIGIEQLPDDIKLLVDLSLRELINIFGTDTSFLDWLRATKAIEDIHEKRLKNAAQEGTLVARDLVKRGVLEPIEAAHVKLLTDGSKTIARRIHSMVEAGRSVEECETFVRSNISKFIRPLKAKVRRTLKK
jgi:hypothetical protein